MTAQVRFERWDKALVLDHADEILAVMTASLGPAEAGDDRLDTLRRHSARRAFTFHAALFDDAGLAGFGYGYVGDPGEWFPDQLAARLPADVTAEWVGGHFEFVTLAVHPDHEGAGIGTRLHDEVMADSPAGRAILMTDSGDSRAVRLYRDRGWNALGAFDPERAVYGRKVSPRTAEPTPDKPAGFLVDDVTDADRFAWARLFRAYLTFYGRPDADRAVREVWRWLVSGQHHLQCMVVRPHPGSAPIGLAHVRQIPRPLLGLTAGFLDDLFVDPAWRGTGAVDAVFSALQELARAQGWSAVRWITSPSNPRAIAVYERHAVRKDAITFELSL
jgi:ribosomal protein S18 acetylase RimI-like enzyme